MNKMMQLKNIIVSLLVLTVLSGCGKDNQPKAAEIPTETHAEHEELVITASQFKAGGLTLGKLQEAEFPAVIRANGIVDVPPEGVATIGSISGGYVVSISLLQGEYVQKGQVLFTLENPEFVQMQQEYLEAQGSLAYLKADYDIQKTLSGENIAAQKTFLKAEAEYKVTQARYESLRKKLAMLNIAPDAITPQNLRSTIAITAPISGFVTDVHANRGMFLSPSDVAVTLTNTDHIHLELDVYEKDLRYLKKEQSLRFHLPDAPGTSYEGSVHLIGKSIDPQKRVVNVHAHLKNAPDSKLFTPGMYVVAEIATESARHISLPEEAIVSMDNKYFVLVKEAGKAGEYKFHQVQVEPGETYNGQTEIRNPEAIEANAEILVKGAFGLINEGGGGGHAH